MATMTSEDIGDPNDVSRRMPSVRTGALPSYVIGVDFGTLSPRAVVVRVDDGTEIGESECHYRHGVMDQELASTGQPLPPDWALQDALDYVAALETAVPQALASSGVDPSKIVGIATDFTACTVLPALSDGTPLSGLPDLRHRPHAYAKLWRHHAAQDQADRINALAEQESEPWLSRYGGRISSEWEFAKGLQLLEEDPALYHPRRDGWRLPTGSSGSCVDSRHEILVRLVTRAYFKTVPIHHRDSSGSSIPSSPSSRQRSWGSECRFSAAGSGG